MPEVSGFLFHFQTLIKYHTSQAVDLPSLTVTEALDDAIWNASGVGVNSQQGSSVQFRRSVMSHSLQPHELHGRLPCPSPTPKAYTNSCSSRWWCHLASPSSVVPFSCLQSFPASGSFQMSRVFASGRQSIGVSASASVLPMNIQDWFPLGLTGWISLQSKGLSRVFNTTVQKHQFFGAQLSL